MKVKRFSAQNMQTALRLVAQELGDDAVIISTQKIADGFEIVAAIDYQPYHTQADVNRQLRLQEELELAKHDLQQRGRADRVAAAKQADVSSKEGLVAALNQLKQPQATLAQPQASVAVPMAPETHSHTESAAIVAMQNELRELKQLLLQQHSSAPVNVPSSSMIQTHSLTQQLQQRCQEVGIDPSLANRLISHVHGHGFEQAWQQIMRWFEKNLPVAQHNLIDKGGCYALVGPTGAGKTTTIGKIAAQAVLKHGADQVALVTLDNYRVAAHDQLRSFARILSIPLKIVAPNGDLNQVLAELSSKKVVLIDTAGLSKQDPHFATQLAMLRKTGLRVRKLLVMPLTNHARSLEENYRQFKLTELSGCIFTKLDECFSLGAALSLAVRGRLPIHFIATGPHIPQDLQRPDTKKIILQAQRMANSTYTKIYHDMQTPTAALR